MFKPVFTPESVTVPKAVIGEYEANARCVLESVDWKTEAQDVCVCRNVFKREWSSALTVERVQALAKVCFYFEDDLQPALTTLCRRKVLRSRTQDGKRLYEVNF